MKILYVTTISLTMNTFFKPHVEMLTKEGHQVDLACNYSELPLDQFYSELGCNVYQIDFSRSPLSFDNVKAYRQLQQVFAEGGYDVVHCHTPNAGVITRLVGRKFRKQSGLKVFYTAHGFHFYKGAPKLNWMVYYPVEKICSHFTDKLITINQEDYRLAKTKLKAKEIHYVPGTGIDISRFQDVKVDRNAKRRELGIPKDAFLLFSVGELNKNKNHQEALRALRQLNKPNVHYMIAGEGPLKEDLVKLSSKLGLEKQFHLLGFREDVAELYKIADCFCFPSIREGLGLAAVEAVAADLYVIAADNRGTRDIIKNDELGVLYKDNLAQLIDAYVTKKQEDSTVSSEDKERKLASIRCFTLECVKEEMKAIYY